MIGISFNLMFTQSFRTSLGFLDTEGWLNMETISFIQLLLNAIIPFPKWQYAVIYFPLLSLMSIVSSVFTVLMPAIAYSLFPLFAVFIFFLLIRNSVIIYAEFVWHENKYFDERKLYVIYSVATFIMGIMALSVLAALASGYGIHLYGYGKESSVPYSASYMNLALFYSHIQVIGFIIGGLILANGIGMVFYKLSDI